MKQHNEIKAKYPDAVLLFRVGQALKLRDWALGEILMEDSAGLEFIEWLKIIRKFA